MSVEGIGLGLYEQVDSLMFNISLLYKDNYDADILEIVDVLVVNGHYAGYGGGLADIDNDGDEDFYFFQNINSSPGLVYYLSEGTSSTHIITNANLNIYPNPVVDFVNIEIDRALSFRVNLYDLAGKLIRSSENTSRFNIESIIPGNYLLEVDQLDSGRKIIDTIVVGQ